MKSPSRALLLGIFLAAMAPCAFAQDKTVIDTTKSPQTPVKMHNNGDGSYSPAQVSTDNSGNTTGTAANPTYTTSVLGTGVTGQVKVAVTGTAVQFNAVISSLINGLTYCAATTNAASVTVGFSSGVTATANGSGNGEVLTPGQCGAKAAISPTNLYVNGTAGDWLSYGGN